MITESVSRAIYCTELVAIKCFYKSVRSVIPLMMTLQNKRRTIRLKKYNKEEYHPSRITV